MSNSNSSHEKSAGEVSVFEAALSLPNESRAELAEQLLESLDVDSSPEITQEMIDEAERRLEAYRQGEIQAVPGEEVMKSLLSGREK